jgi:hypothetical protein
MHMYLLPAALSKKLSRERPARESRSKFKSYLSLARTGSRCPGEACTMEKEGTCISWLHELIKQAWRPAAARATTRSLAAE